MKFTDIFVRRPVLSLVVSLLILLIGGMSMLALPIRQYPRLYNTTITVTTAYPGASPDLIQGFITTPIEQAVSSAEGIDYLTSSSTQNTSTVTAYVKLNYDPNQALTDVMAKVQQVKYLMPQQAQDPIILKSTGQTTAVMYIGFASDELSSAAISDYLTRVVQPLLATVEGVASADILGGQTFAMRLWLDPVAHGGAQRLGRRRDQRDPRQQLPVRAGPGERLLHRHQHLGRYRADRYRPVQAHDRQGRRRRGGAARRHRHHRARRAELELQRHDERPAGRLHRGAGDADRQPADDRQGRAGADARDQDATCRPAVKMQVAYDSTRFIQSSIDEVQTTLAEAVAIVVVVIFLFLGSFRSVLIPIVTIPLSLIGAGIIMAAMGFSLNLLTLAGDGAGDRAGRR